MKHAGKLHSTVLAFLEITRAPSQERQQRKMLSSCTVPVCFLAFLGSPRTMWSTLGALSIAGHVSAAKMRGPCTFQVFPAIIGVPSDHMNAREDSWNAGSAECCIPAHFQRVALVGRITKDPVKHFCRVCELSGRRCCEMWFPCTFQVFPRHHRSPQIACRARGNPPNAGSAECFFPARFLRVFLHC